ncbi:MAG: protein translocase subunit SecD [Treponema sp.]|nr:protein translocase subunit SecD [Treponema sp.]
MNKRNRFILILAVLGVCLYALWPSISWYFRVSEEDQKVALYSLEKIRDYSVAQAVKDVKALEQLARTNSGDVLPSEYAWLEKKARENYKLFGRECPKQLTVSQVVLSFGFGRAADTEEQKKAKASSIEAELVDAFQTRYREAILKNKNYYQNAVKLGLDLAGGVSVIIKADLDAVVAAANTEGNVLQAETVEALKAKAMDHAIESLTSRIDRFGLTEPVIRKQGDDHIYIEIPGNGQADAMRTIVQGKGILNFRIVDDEASQNFSTLYHTNQVTFDENGNLSDPSVIPEDCEVLGYYVKDAYGLDQFADYLVVKKDIALEGKYVKSAMISSDKMGKTGVDFTLDAEGAQIFADVTAKNTKKRLAIVSDNKIKSAPVIKNPIPGGQVRVDGFGIEEAQNLQKVLETAWLDVPLEVESQQVVGATLGAISIKQGLWALVIGLAAIMVFMLFFYKGAGINAVVAQILNLYILFSVLSAFNLTLTLPSIAGMILTIGMAVDANVIIFERIKEELYLGKDRKSAVVGGFDNAFWSIMDSNITTFIAALFLSVLGTGAIQGFAVSLAIGVASSVFTALFVSRLIFDFGTDVMHSSKVSISWRIK